MTDPYPPGLLMWGHVKFEIRDLILTLGEPRKGNGDISYAWGFQGPHDSLWLLYSYMHTPQPDEGYDWHIRTTHLPMLETFQEWLRVRVDETVNNTRYIRIRKASL